MLSIRAKAMRTSVFTNGCFDLLHMAHIDFLYKASQLADDLVVAVNSDASVRRLKGAGRPFIPEKERIYLVAALRFVYNAVLFNTEADLEELIELFHPDILVKGGDWKRGTITGAEIVEGYGGRVMTIPIAYPNITTTTIANRIKGVN